MSLLAISKIAWALGVVCWYVLRIPFQRKARRQKVKDASHRNLRDMTLLTISTCGLGIIPGIYAVTGWPAAASYPITGVQVVAGIAVFIGALWLFWSTHKAIGRDWSVTLEIKEQHKLVTDGVYRHVRHPMYSAFFLWAVAQLLLLPNLIAGLAGLVGFGILFFFRVGREEQMMREAFGPEYDAYMQRSKRIIPGIY
ncbi:protein-S-isoprenylcysteine O-methyltransferase [Xanthobacter sp. TB0139]|uniref:protein-S-isoprenylcysteine O-methyltransferase n=1 Tax=Xanthobacter sp. TB0139 TaxID=3459178 RepID=UPI00403A5226